jgi:uncharacterized protein YyaL (SSP411 family)
LTDTNRKPNRLIHEASPYLQQHAYNPVDWYAWGPEALERAKAEDKPIFLSVGYSSCHWCHVMEHESFSDPEIARLMNEHFVCIKVDREERPDIDAIYQTVCQVVTRHGGWPLSVWLTPDQKPFYVGTYFPPAPRYGRPGFPEVLQGLAKAWREKRAEIEQVAQNWTQAIHLTEASPEAAADIPGEAVIAQAAEAMLKRIDWTHGGFGGAPKFPNSFSLELMLRHGEKVGDAQMREGVLLTLRKMAAGGIYDHLAGGFHRYSVDAQWAVPHFEKMLYDNAVLPPLYLQAWQVSGDDAFRRVAEETLDWVLREMTAPEGGFYSTTDADSEGEEGKFFVFDPAEISEAVGTELGALLCRHFGVTEEGNFAHTGKTVLHIAETAEALARQTGAPLDAIQAKLAEGKRMLLAYRAKRIPPFRDEKILTAWNGLMISALARAGRILRAERFTQAAEAATRFILERLVDEKGRLLRRFKGAGSAPASVVAAALGRTGAAGGGPAEAAGLPTEDQVGIHGFLEDYAYFTAALVDLYEATFDETYLNLAIQYHEETLRLFWDEAEGAFFLTPPEGEGLIHRPKDSSDASTPAGASVAVMTGLRLIPFTGKERYRAVAERTFRTWAEHMRRFPGGMATLLAALDLYLSSPTEVTLVGEAPEAWLAELGRRYLPNLVLTQIGAPREERPIWAGKKQVEGKPTAYVCRNFACSAPVTSWAELAGLL